MHQFKETCTDEATIIIRDSFIDNVCRRYLALKLWALDNPYKLIGNIKEADIISIENYFRSEAFSKLETLHDGEWFIEEYSKEAEYIHLKKIEKEMREANRKRLQERKRRRELWKSQI